MTILDCQVFRCKSNKAGKCPFEKVTLQDVGSAGIIRIICIESELRKDKESDEKEKPTRCGYKPIEHEIAWGTPKEEVVEDDIC